MLSNVGKVDYAAWWTQQKGYYNISRNFKHYKRRYFDYHTKERKGDGLR